MYFKLKTIFTAIFMTAVACSAAKTGFSPQQEAFRDLKYGCFIHWNHSSIWGEQISFCRGGGEQAAKYDALPQEFKAEDFDADKWAQILKDSGFTYVVLVPKHHDGFCMFETKSTDHNVMEKTPFGKDYIKLASTALRKKGIKVCLYYSIMDWKQPSYSSAQGADLTAYKKIMYQQLDELLSKYGPITAMWFDGHWDPSWTQEQGRALYEFVKSKQPDCLFSNRVGPMPKVAGPIGSAAGSFSNENDKLGDYLTPERKMGAFFTDYPWEVCLPLDKDNKWSWMPNGGFHNRDKQEIVRWLLEAAGGGGNLLLGVGPNEHGVIDPYHAERLMEVGVYLKLYGDTVYNTRPGPYLPGNWDGVCLSKGKKIYLHIFGTQEKTAGGKQLLKLPALGAKVIEYKMVSGTVDRHATNYTLGVKQTDDSLQIELHQLAPKIVDFIVELTLDKDAQSIPYIDTGKRSVLEDHTAAPE